MNDMRACAVIPVYEHHLGVAQVLERLRATGLPCILVDDGSSERCAAALAALAAADPDRIELLRLPRNRGKGAAVLHGMRRAAARGFTHTLQVDADGQHDTGAAPAFLAAAAAEPRALVLGRPVYDASVPAARLHGRRITRFWIHVNTLSRAIEDGMCGFRVYPLAATLALADRVRLGPRMEFDIDVAVRLQRDGVPVLNLPVAVTYPAGGISHFRMWRDNLRISLAHTRLFFGMLASLPGRAMRGVHWARMAEAGSVAGMQLMYAVHARLGRGPFLVLLAPLMMYYYAARGVARRASREYLSRIFPGRSAAALAWLGYRHFLAFGQCLLDKALVWTSWLPARMEFHGMAPLWRQLHEEHRGALLLVSHLGNMEMLRALAQLHQGTPLTVLVHTRHAQKFTAFVERINPDNQLDLLQVTEVGPATAVLLDQRVRTGHIVVIAADRVPVSGSRVARVPFLGAPAPFPVGPHVLGALLGCPVWLMFCLRLGDCHQVYFEPFAERIELPRRGREQHLAGWAARYAQRLEHHCRIAPFQWFNFYPFWDDAAPARPRAESVAPSLEDA